MQRFDATDGGPPFESTVDTHAPKEPRNHALTVADRSGWLRERASERSCGAGTTLWLLTTS